MLPAVCAFRRQATIGTLSRADVTRAVLARDRARLATVVAIVTGLASVADTHTVVVAIRLAVRALVLTPVSVI